MTLQAVVLVVVVDSCSKANGKRLNKKKREREPLSCIASNPGF
jgi:hypothetical protein